MKPPKPIYSYLAAALLAAITLATFYVFRDFGPQSVLRKFHTAAPAYRWKELEGLIYPGKNAQEAELQRQAEQWLVQYLAAIAQGNPTYEIVSMKRMPREVQAAVEYRFPNGMSRGVVWHVRQMENDWRIDCLVTARGIFRRTGGL